MAGPTNSELVGNLLVKCAQVILGARQANAKAKPRPARPVQTKPSKTWFNLEIEEVESAVRELEPWRTQTTAPMVLEVYLQAWGSQHADGGLASCHPQPGETTLERWTLQFTPRSQAAAGSGRGAGPRLDTPAVYKRMVIMLRSLYSHVRILPAYRLCRACQKDGRGSYGIRYRIAPAASPDMRSGATGRLQSYNFDPLEMPDGSFAMSLVHQPTTAVRILEKTTSPPPPPQIIPNYVDCAVASQRTPPARHSTLSASLHMGGAVPEQPAACSPPTAAHGAPMLRRHNWSMQGRAASARLSSAGSDMLPPQTPPSPQYSPRQQQGTPPQTLRTLSTPPRYPTALSSPRVATRSSSSGASPPHLPQLRPRPGAPGPSRLSPTEAGVMASPLPRSPAVAASAPRRLLQASSCEPALDAQPSGEGCTSRHISAPMRIPGRTGGHRLLSSVDLHTLDTQRHGSPAEAAAAAPSSAPAGVHRPQVQAGWSASKPPHADAATPFAMQHPLAQPTEVGSSAPATPATPQMPPMAPHFGSAGSSSSAGYQMGSSPQLPFAVTPSSSHSLASLAAAADAHSHPWGPGGLANPSPPLSGRHHSAMSAVRQQRSWGGRSSSGNQDSQTGETLVGYSVSPMAHGSLASSVVSTSRAFSRNNSYGGGGAGGPGPPSGVLAMPVPLGSGFAPSGQLPCAPAAAEHIELTAEESSDILPFALDESPVGTAGGDGLLAGAVDSEEALGAFVRMLEHAPPLHGPRADFGDGAGASEASTMQQPRMTLAAGLDQLAQLREALPKAVAT